MNQIQLEPITSPYIQGEMSKSNTHADLHDGTNYVQDLEQPPQSNLTEKFTIPGSLKSIFRGERGFASCWRTRLIFYTQFVWSTALCGYSCVEADGRSGDQQNASRVQKFGERDLSREYLKFRVRRFDESEMSREALEAGRGPVLGLSLFSLSLENIADVPD